MSEPKTVGLVSVVATPIGNLEDITLRALRTLREADLIAAEDTRAARRLLESHAIRPAGLVSYFEGNEAERTEAIMQRLADGARIAVISEAGHPGISDPGHRLISRAIADGYRVEVIPGPSAVVTALVGSGLDTHRFEFIGFLPRTAGARRQLLGTLRGQIATLVFYESPNRVAATLADLVDAFGEDRPAVLARELTKLHEEFVRGTLAQLAERYRAEPPRGECTLVVAGAAEERAAADDVEAAVRRLLDSGLGPKDVAARLVVQTGKPRRQLYQLALSIAREPGGGSADGEGD